MYSVHAFLIYIAHLSCNVTQSHNSLRVDVQVIVNIYTRVKGYVSKFLRGSVSICKEPTRMKTYLPVLGDAIDRDHDELRRNVRSYFQLDMAITFPPE